MFFWLYSFIDESNILSLAFFYRWFLILNLYSLEITVVNLKQAVSLLVYYSAIYLQYSNLFLSQNDTMRSWLDLKVFCYIDCVHSDLFNFKNGKVSVTTLRCIFWWNVYINLLRCVLDLYSITISCILYDIMIHKLPCTTWILIIMVIMI